MKKKVLLSLITGAGIGLIAAGEYFFKYAMTPYKKKPDPKKISPKDSLYREKLWFKNFPKQEWHLNTNNLTLCAQYLDHHSNKTVILLHGFMSDSDSMGGFAKMFYDFGYNVLLPDARAQGKSEGQYIGYGWVEKEDIAKWINEIIQKNGADSKIVIMGQSMGGATTMMVSGMKLPKQVKAFIEDCGYSNVKEEIKYQAGNLFSIPKIIQTPLIETVSGINKLKNGFFLGKASSANQLSKNNRPFLFIHGGKDHFVPTKMAYENYQASNGPKEIWIAPLAGHALSYPMYKTEYRKQIKAFLDKYVH
ncbi:alpha/beta hydrolase [Lactobacillus acidophilus]|uniref:alpha/beta hydrolase n=1 Tax=Lactobacillus acidophilus TaxID=1579 RepID=UPI0021A5D32B|nr:alpha/beta hydrolase [Lactobacillus acidophilus]MCT3602449.1 alpha/beta hydrolase [Lactobacillus acidophilus]MCT3623625.1 alpha/beta hydrolase [Lactobacillus acidophilus]